MATPLGTGTVTSIVKQHVIPEITDVIYGANPLFFRWYNSKKRMIQGGTQIEHPWMYKRFTNGGPYRGYQVLDVAPNDTLKTGAWDWKQQYVPVAIDGLTLIITDSPEAIANIISLQFEQANMEMIENLAEGMWSAGTDALNLDGIEMAVDDAGVAATYGGLARSGNTFLNAQDDSTTSALTFTALQALFGRCSKGGRHPSIILSRQEQYNRFADLFDANQDYPVGPSGSDEILLSAGFTNLLFNNVPWVVDDHVFNGPNASNSAIVMLNEDYWKFIVSPRADFYTVDFQEGQTQDAMVSRLQWAGNIICSNPGRQGKLSNISS